MTSTFLHVFVCILYPPAVDHDGPCGGRVGDFDPADEGKQSRGVIRDAVIGPAGEVELLDLAHLVEATLGEEKRG